MKVSEAQPWLAGIKNGFQGGKQKKARTICN